MAAPEFHAAPGVKELPVQVELAAPTPTGVHYHRVRAGADSDGGDHRVGQSR